MENVYNMILLKYNNKKIIKCNNNKNTLIDMSYLSVKQNVAM